MQRSRLFRFLIVAAALVVLAVGGVFALQPAGVFAEGKGDIGRYQISSWASYSGARVHHAGYYVLDTTTGEVVDSHHEIHDIDSASMN